MSSSGRYHTWNPDKCPGSKNKERRSISSQITGVTIRETQKETLKRKKKIK
ncbi:MAG: hypothetical protein IIB00_09040 [candidate division Zixibacteria bacterium]|nr:hypothetical protein [candidate division Zixibacteria bacterium]